ncbi:MAG: radical SAM protein [Deltaproteobacteria bacterium]|jgi:sulfatase maturation enzyme AslB (radical SAM superfamily)|nr:radical SAM protein [Deltaproteobacteria bacterium]
MKFCNQLPANLNIEPGLLLPCCIGGERAPSIPFSGGALNVAAYKDFIRLVVDILQADAAVCRGCASLFETDEIPGPGVYDDIRFKLVTINHHRHFCNCKCVYCPFWGTGDKKKLPDILPTIRSLMEQDALHPDCNINWGGGESTILPEFEASCSWIRGQGYWQSVHTNALRISPAIVAFLAEGRGSINLSLDSGSALGYAKVKGVNGWDKVINTLKAYRAAAKDATALEVKYIIFSQNNARQEIEGFFSLCAALDIRNTMYTFEGGEISTGRLHKDTIFAAALFKHLAKTSGVHCSEFYVSDDAKRTVENMRQRCFG